MNIKQIRSKFRPLRELAERILGRFSPKLLVEILFKRLYGRPINWQHPVDINEKINWLKFHSNSKHWAMLADKYRVRNYVESKGLGHTLVQLYGKWNSAGEIDWQSLPNQFVIKTNHGSGDVMICEDKSKINTKQWSNLLGKNLNRQFAFIFGEPHYRFITPCIIAEELLDKTKQSIPSTSLVDYKIWSFNGKPAYIVVYSNRTKEKVEAMVYDTNWQAHPRYLTPSSHLIISKQETPRPASLKQMLDIASKLSEGLPEVRVDLYEVGGKVYFGELTLTASGGFNYYYSMEFREILGHLTILPTDYH